MITPQLYVFAGPNGAGKSSLSASMVPSGTPIFDGDKEFAKLRKTFAQTDSGILYDAINGHIFDDWKNLQIARRADCAFETNFRSEQVMDSVTRFKQAGYSVRLLFFGLDTIEAAIERVKLRVASGGHDVSLANITTNYTEGLNNLTKFYKEFDSVHLLQNFAEAGQVVQVTPLMHIEKGEIIEQITNLPGWLNALNQSLSKQAKRPRRNKGLGL